MFSLLVLKTAFASAIESILSPSQRAFLGSGCTSKKSALAPAATADLASVETNCFSPGILENIWWWFYEYDKCNYFNDIILYNTINCFKKR